MLPQSPVPPHRPHVWQSASRVVKEQLWPLVPPALRGAIRVRLARRGADPEWKFVPRFCDRDALSIDVGANQGLFSWQMLPASRGVVAFEPYAPLAERLRADFGARLQVEQCALSDRDGEATMAVPRFGGRDLPTRCTLERDANAEFERRMIRVRTRRLDGTSLAPVGFVKIDVEGHEVAVLRGAEAVIARDCPTLLVSCEERLAPGNREAVARMLLPGGYTGWFFDHGRVAPLDAFDVGVHQRPELAKPPGAPGYTDDYVFNFLFIHRSRDHVLQRLR